MKNFTYLREMSVAEKENADSLVNKCIDSLPYTLASPVNKMFGHIACQEYGKAMNYALDFVEMSSQYISSLLLVQLIEIERTLPMEQRRVNRVVQKIDNKRPLSLGDWINDILTPLLLAAKERMGDDQLVTCLTGNLLRKQTCVLLGDKREPSVVQIRNEYRGHSTTLSENIYKGVIYTLQPQILNILRAVEPLCSYEFHSVPEEGKMLSHKGAGTSIESNDGKGELMHYYAEHNGKSTDLFPLVMVNTEGCVYVFQTLKI